MAQDSAPILDIRPVTRDAAKLVIGLVATSGEGKTYSALQLALGLAGGNPKKVGLLDMENRRGSMYADIFDEPFLIGDLSPPFSPARYARAMRQFAETGIEALVIDSMSHEHEGEGGLEEIANAPKANGESRKVADWLTAKREHKRMMNTLLFLPCHIITCFRAREKTSFKDPTKPVSLGLQPVCEKNVLFEMSASFLLREQGKKRDVIKLPENLRAILGGEGYLTPEHGLKLREFVGGKDPIENAKNILRLAASEGMARLGEAWTGLEKAQRVKLGAFKETLKETAQHADREREEAEAEPAGKPDRDLPPPPDDGAPAPEQRDAEGNFKF